MNRTAIFCCSAVCLSILGAAALLAAGPLNPPAGPVASTYKTLTEVEPRIAINAANTPGDAASTFKVTQPGSYYLTANVTGTSGKSGISIGASNVTLDLCGFAVVGVPGSLSGVTTVAGPLSNITVRNGTVSSWGNSGVDLEFAATDNTLIESINSRSNGFIGIRGGSAGVVRFCVASHNASYGIIGYESSVLESCSAQHNGDIGFAVGPASVLRACIARDNTGTGFTGSNNSLFSGCSSYSNDASGFSVSFGSQIENCTAANNASDGFDIGGGCVIRGCTAYANGVTTATGAGIHVLGGDCRVEGNTCTNSDLGIDVDFAGNVIVRNTCANNANNWTIVANNVVGPILDRTAPASAAISGNAAPSSLGSTDANANYSY